MNPLFFLALAAFAPFIAIGQTNSSPEKPGAENPRVTWEPRDTGHVVAVHDLAAGQLSALEKAALPKEKWERLLSVWTESGDIQSAAKLPPMSGTYTVESDRIEFRPAYPLVTGLSYVAVFFPERLPGGKGAAVSAKFALPKNKDSSAEVETILPSARVLPENLLKFYVRFSAPMSRGKSYEHIRLTNEKGEDIELPFLELDEELWNPDMTRLTLFIDPGRIKREVRPLVDLGPALETGKTYTLSINDSWKDARHQALKSGSKKTFQVGPPDRRCPDPKSWKIKEPKRNSKNPLLVEFDEPLDHALATRMITIETQEGTPVSGLGALVDGERSWRFTPESPWTAKPYRLAIRAIIEDLAGNNIGKPFEVDLEENITQQILSETVYLPWSASARN